jgi:GWxTD domain-containing protein
MKPDGIPSSLPRLLAGALVVVVMILTAWGAEADTEAPDDDPLEPEMTEEALTKLVNAHPDSAMLYAQLASVHFKEGTVEGRAQAVTNLKHALRLEPENVDFRRLLAEVYFESSFWRYGVEELKTAIETDGRNGYARYRLGKAYLDRATEEWQDEWFVSSQFQLSKVPEEHPAYCSARRRLALCYHDIGMMDSSIAVLRGLPEDSLNVDALLVLGMSLQKQKDMIGANETFLKALSMMEEDQHARYTTPELLASEDQLRELTTASALDDRARREFYWRKRDPNPATKINERFVEHMARVAFAELHFSVPRLGRHGSQTTRGEVYIRYGNPMAWYYDPFGTNVFCDETLDPIRGWEYLSPQAREDLFHDLAFAPRSRPLRVEKSRWVWQYRDFVLEFEDTFLNGDYSFPYENDWSAYTYAYLENEIPEVYESEIKKNMRVVVDAVNLMGPRGGSYIRISYACDTRGLDYVPDFEWPRGEFDIEIAVLDSFYRDVARTRFSAELFADSAAIFQTRFPLIGSQIVEAPPGRTVTAISVESKTNGAVGFTSGTLDVRRFGEDLEISDLELRFDQDGPPNPSRSYLRRGDAYMAFMIYNLDLGASGTGEAEVSYRITKRTTRPGRFRRLLSIFIGDPGDDEAGSVASLWSKYDLRTEGPVAREVVGIDLTSLSSGFYDVEVEVVDKTSGQVVREQTELRVSSELEL